MDNLDNAFFWTILGLPVLVMAALYVLRSRYNELIALHVIVFWAQFFAYGAVWLYAQPSFHFPGWTMLLLSFELTVYCAALIIGSEPFRNFAHLVSDAALDIPPSVLFFWIALSMGVSLYIVAVYGVVALFLYATLAQSAGLPAWLLYLNGLLLIPAWGATYCCSIRVAYRRFHPVVMLATAFVLERMVFEGGDGKRLFLIVCVVAVLFGRGRPFKITWRQLVGGLTAAALVFAMWSWYEGVRGNLRYTLTSGRSYDTSLEMVESILVPSSQNSSAADLVVSKNLMGRTPPIWFLIQVFDLPHLADGAFISQAIQNIMPSVLSNKQYRHENQVLADSYGFPYDDYPWTLLTEMNAEVSVFAAALAPLFYLGLFWLCWCLMGHWRGQSNMLVLAAIGVAVLEAGEVQTMLGEMLPQVRALFIYLALAFGFWHLRRIARLVLLRSGLHPRTRSAKALPILSSSLKTTQV